MNSQPDSIGKYEVGDERKWVAGGGILGATSEPAPFLYASVFCAICAMVYVCIVRGQLLGVSHFFHHMDSEDRTQVIRLAWQAL